MKIKIKRNVYGKDYAYPADERAEKWLLLLNKGKTFSQEQLSRLRELGETVEEVDA